MRIGKYLSIISIVIALVLIVLKSLTDLSFYNGLIKVFPDDQSDFSPSLVVIGIRHIILFSIPILISLVLSIVGLKKKNKYRKPALIINIFTIVYLIIPIGAILAIMKNT